MSNEVGSELLVAGRPGRRAPPTSCKFILAKLFTKEDPIYLHKTLGILSLSSFVYRYFLVYPSQGNLGFNGSWFDWASMILHLMLSTSSLIFHVLAHRILNRPMIIWEEYRLHAIVFTLRCFSVFCFGIYNQGKRTDEAFTALYFLVLFHHFLADQVTRIYGSPNQTTVRVQNKSSFKTKVVLRGYAFYQFLALGSHLIPHVRDGDLGFNTLIAIQSSAFLMTLFRKNLISHTTHGLWYGSCLILSGFHILQLIPSWSFFIKVTIVYLLRLNFRKIPKYILWAGFSLSCSPFGKSVLASQAMSIPIPANVDLTSHLQELSNLKLNSWNYNSFRLGSIDFSILGKNQDDLLLSSSLVLLILGLGWAANTNTNTNTAKKSQAIKRKARASRSRSVAQQK